MGCAHVCARARDEPGGSTPPLHLVPLSGGRRLSALECFERHRRELLVEPGAPAAATAATAATVAVTPSVPPPHQRGVSVAFLQAFSVATPVNATTRDVVASLVVPSTGGPTPLPAIALFSDMLGVDANGTAHPVCGAPRFFISHPWDRPFADTVSAVVQHCSNHNIDPTRCYVWIDVLCLNQHNELPGSGGLDDTALSSTFASVIRACEGTLVMADPFDRPRSLERVWCVYEVYATVALGAAVHLIFSPSQQASFVSALGTRGCGGLQALDGALDRIDVANAEADDASDVAILRRWITHGRAELGLDGIPFVAIDNLVRQALWQWLRQVILGLLDERDERDEQGHAEPDETTFELLVGAAELCKHLGELGKVEVFARRALGCCGRPTRGTKARLLLISSLLAQGKVEEAKERWIPETLALVESGSVEGLAALRGRGREREVEREHGSNLGRLAERDCEREDYSRVLRYKAVALSSTDLDASIGLFHEAVEGLSQALGARHPEVGVTFVRLGIALQRAGRQGDAVGPCRTGVEILESAPHDARSHPSELATAMIALARAYSHTRAFDLAVPLYARALAMDERAGDGRATANTLTSYANCLKAMGRAVEAEALYARVRPSTEGGGEAEANHRGDHV